MADVKEWLGNEVRRLCDENAKLLDQVSRTARANDELRARLQAPLPEGVARLREMLTSYAPDPEEEAEIVAILERLSRGAQEVRREALEEAVRMSTSPERTRGNPQSDSAAAPGEEDDEDMSGPRQDFKRQCERLADEEDDLNAAPPAISDVAAITEKCEPAVAAPTREDVNIYMRNGGSPSIGALALRGLDGPSENEIQMALYCTVGWSEPTRILARAVLRWHEGRKT